MQSSSSIIQRHAVEFLKSLSVIRVYVNDAPGHGDQTKIAQTLSKLISIGYQGSFEVIYDDKTVDKVSRVFSIDYKLDLHTPFLFKSNDIQITFLSATYFFQHKNEMQSVKFSFGGEYEKRFRIFDKDKNKWSYHHAEVSTFKTGIYFNVLHGYIYTQDVGDLAAIKGDVIFPVQKMEDTIELLRQKNSSEGRALSYILEGTKFQQFNIWPIYGMDKSFLKHINPGYTIANLIFGLRNAQLHDPEKFLRPTVMLLLNDFEQELLNSLQQFVLNLPQSYPDADEYLKKLTGKIKISEFVKFQLINSSHVIEGIQQLNREHFLVINVGHLDRRIFDALMIYSNLPPLREGLSSERLLLNKGQPSIPCHTYQDFMFGDFDGFTGSDLITHLQSPINVFWRNLQSAACSKKFASGDFKAPDYIAAYLIGLFNNSDIAKRWSQKVENFHLPSNDLILNELSNASQISLPLSTSSELFEYPSFKPLHIILQYALALYTIRKINTCANLSKFLIFLASLTYDVYADRSEGTIFFFTILCAKNFSNIKNNIKCDALLACLSSLFYFISGSQTQKPLFFILGFLSCLAGSLVVLTAMNPKTSFFHANDSKKNDFCLPEIVTHSDKTSCLI